MVTSGLFYFQATDKSIVSAAPTPATGEAPPAGPRVLSRPLPALLSNTPLYVLSYGHFCFVFFPGHRQAHRAGSGHRRGHACGPEGALAQGEALASGPQAGAGG